MKREDLKAKGLTDEQIDFIMAENGKDVEAVKAKFTTAEAEAKALKDQLAEAGKQIEAFKGMDIEGVKKSADEWKAKAEAAHAEAEKQLAALKFDHALDGVTSRSMRCAALCIPEWPQPPANINRQSGKMRNLHTLF